MGVDSGGVGLNVFVDVDQRFVDVEREQFAADLNRALLDVAQHGKQNASAAKKDFEVVVDVGWELGEQFVEYLRFSSNPLQQWLGNVYGLKTCRVRRVGLQERERGLGERGRNTGMRMRMVKAKEEFDELGFSGCFCFARGSDVDSGRHTLVEQLLFGQFGKVESIHDFEVEGWL